MPLEIIIADAASTDNTRSIATEFGAKIVNGGYPGVGRNNGAKVAQGDLYLFLDADVIIKDNRFIEKSLKEFEKKNLDLSNFKFGLVGYWKADFIHFSWNFVQKIYLILNKPVGSGAAILIKKDVFNKLKGFNEKLEISEDYDFIRRATLGNFKFGILKQKIYPSPRRYIKFGLFNVLKRYVDGTINANKSL
jgi:glycosyltransferase involved in cell wall biosynthesis